MTDEAGARRAASADIQLAPEGGEAIPRTVDPAESGPNAGGREFGEIIAVGTRPAGGGRIELADPPKPGEPTMRWLSHAHSIDEIESELNRIWAQPNLLIGPGGQGAGPAHRRADVGDEPRRRRAPAGGRRACRRDDPAADRPPPVADAHRPVGGPGRPAVARGADPGALRPAPRGRARDLHRADLPDRRRRDRPPSHRARGAAARARPAGDRVVARRAAARPRARPRPARGHRPARHRRLCLVRRRAPAAVPAGRAVRRLPAPGDPGLRARPAVALAGGDRVGVRPPGLHPVPRLDPADRRHLRDPRRDRRPRARPTSSSRCTTSRGSPRGWGCG